MATPTTPFSKCFIWKHPTALSRIFPAIRPMNSDPAAPASHRPAGASLFAFLHRSQERSYLPVCFHFLPVKPLPPAAFAGFAFFRPSAPLPLAFVPPQRHNKGKSARRWTFGDTQTLVPPAFKRTARPQCLNLPPRVRPAVRFKIRAAAFEKILRAAQPISRFKTQHRVGKVSCSRRVPCRPLQDTLPGLSNFSACAPFPFAVESGFFQGMQLAFAN